MGRDSKAKRAGSRKRAVRRGGRPGEAQFSQPVFAGPPRNGGRKPLLAPAPVRKSFSRAPLPAPRGPDGTPQSRIRNMREQRADEKTEVRAAGILGPRELVVVVAWCRAGRWRAAKPIRAALRTGSPAESLRDGRGRLPKRRPTRSSGPSPLRVNATQRRRDFRVVETEAAPPAARRGSIRAAEDRRPSPTRMPTRTVSGTDSDASELGRPGEMASKLNWDHVQKNIVKAQPALSCRAGVSELMVGP